MSAYVLLDVQNRGDCALSPRTDDKRHAITPGRSGDYCPYCGAIYREDDD